MGITQSHEFCKAGKAIPQALAFAYGKPDDDPVVHVANYCTFVNLNFITIYHHVDIIILLFRGPSSLAAESNNVAVSVAETNEATMSPL